MARIQLVRYWKRYMRKGRYHCKRYSLYLPVAIGDQLDRSVDYVVHLFGPAIVAVPKGTEFSLSNLENQKSANRQNDAEVAASSTNLLQENSKQDA